MAVDITAKDVIFIRQLGRKLERVKSEQSKLIASQEISRLVNQANSYNARLQVMSRQERNAHEANRAAIGVDYVDYFLSLGADNRLANPFATVFDSLVEKFPQLSASAPEDLSHNDILEFIDKAVQSAEKNCESTYKAMHKASSNDDGAAKAGYDDALEAFNKLKTAKDAYFELLEEQKAAVDERLEEQLQLEIDKAALGLEQVPADVFKEMWAFVFPNFSDSEVNESVQTDDPSAPLISNTEAKKELGNPRHHAEFLEDLKEHFKRKTGADSDLETLNEAYRNARAHYFQLLRKKRNEKDELEGDKYNYTLGYEKKRIEHEIANYELDQKVLRKGLLWAKAFALAQGFFAAGATYTFLAMLNPILGLVAIPVSLGLFFYVARSNWLTINEEMGPLVKELFFNPAHTGWPLYKKIFYLIRNSEFSFRQMFNTGKGTTNLIAGLFLGLLTFAGSIALLTLTMGFIPMGPALSVAMFGEAPLPILMFATLFALVNTFVYFVITNINQQKKNNGTMGGEEKEKELEQLRKVDHASSLHFHKNYGFNIALALGGISAALVGASPVLLELVGAGVTQSAVLNITVFGMGASATLGLAAVIVGAIVFAACYGISSFYQSRTYGATRGLITNSIGAELNAEKLAKNLDVTGRDAPDFRELKAERTPKVGLWAAFVGVISYPVYKLFNMDKNDDNSEWARRINALGQGMPSFSGAYDFFKVLANSAGFVIGGGAMIAAASGSYSANSVGLRHVDADVTELEVLRRDLVTMEGPNGPLESTAYKLGEKKAEVERYVSGRERLGNHYGFGFASSYTKDDKLDAAQSMTKQLDALVERPEGYTVQDEDSTPNVQLPEDRSNRTQKRLNYLYDAHERNHDKHENKFNPLRNGELGNIARDTEELMKQWKPGTRSA